jgi:nitroimidazol reductase NimA-like FMN-containing flavoprotein (pyridoxamine 5'-phosphate oxidase superfamily)
VIYARRRALYVASIEGQKIEMMRANPFVCFEVDSYGPEGWRSAVVQGVYEELSEAETPKALELLRERFPANGGARRRSPETHGRPTVCFRIRVHSATGRTVIR